MARRKKKSVSRTLVAIVLDKSYSMMDRHRATIDAMNEYINTLRTDGEGEIIASMLQFDDRAFEKTYTNTPIAKVPKMDTHNYRPRGMTPLYDAIGHMIRNVESEDDNSDDKVIVVIQTDGMENASKEYTREAVMALRDEKEKDGWEFVFLGTGVNAWAAGKNLGFRKSQTVNYGTQDPHDHTAAVYLAASASVTTTQSRRGARASESFLSVSPEKSRLEDKAKGKTTRRARKTPA